MKTKNNVQKAILRSCAVIVSFVLVSFTVTAQGYWKQLLTNNSFSQIATALVDHRPSTPTENRVSDVSAIIAEDVNSGIPAEASLNVESWMTGSEDFWDAPGSSSEVSEPALTLENWMVNSEFFETGRIQDKSLEMKEWMVSDNFWK